MSLDLGGIFLTTEFTCLYCLLNLLKLIASDQQLIFGLVSRNTFARYSGNLEAVGPVLHEYDQGIS